MTYPDVHLAPNDPFYSRFRDDQLDNAFDDAMAEHELDARAIEAAAETLARLLRNRIEAGVTAYRFTENGKRWGEDVETTIANVLQLVGADWDAEDQIGARLAEEAEPDPDMLRDMMEDN